MGFLGGLDIQKWEGSIFSSVASPLTVTSDSTAHTKGAYSEAITSLDHYTDVLYVSISNCGVADSRYLLDVAVGAAASENVIIPNLYAQELGSFGANSEYVLPVSIAAGERIALRCQAGGVSQGCNVICHAGSGGFHHMRGATKYHAMGVDTANTRGVSLTPGASGSKGSYAEITSSAPADLHGLWLCILNQARDTSMNETKIEVDLAIGAAASEEIVVPDIQLYAETTNDGITPGVTFLPIPIAEGTRVAVRAAESSANGAATYDTILYGVS